MSRGKWRGTVAQVILTVNDNVQVTLPRGMLAILGAAIQGEGDQFRQVWKVPVSNEWFQWIPGGPGYVSNPPYNTVGFVSQGDGFVMFKDLPSAGTIKIYNTTTESAGTINIRGLSGGDKVYTGVGAARVEGENVAQPTTANTSTATATTWDSGNSLYGIVKPATNGIIKFYHVAPDLTETLIGSYEPGEVNPCYRRYLVPQRWNNNGRAVLFVKRRHYDVLVDNDEVIPGNLSALEMACMAVDFRRKADQLAHTYIDMAIEELNSELTQYDAETSYGTAQIDASVGMGTVWNAI